MKDSKYLILICLFLAKPTMPPNYFIPLGSIPGALNDKKNKAMLRILHP